ncbi:hypothetical protein J6590_013396 [Homalodisca vitripennis]|nr:hypothetical protein J6590_013396 [Homalodisca vitripennis]
MREGQGRGCYRLLSNDVIIWGVGVVPKQANEVEEKARGRDGDGEAQTGGGRRERGGERPEEHRSEEVETRTGISLWQPRHLASDLAVVPADLGVDLGGGPRFAASARWYT